LILIVRVVFKYTKLGMAVMDFQRCRGREYPIKKPDLMRISCGGLQQHLPYIGLLRLCSTLLCAYRWRGISAIRASRLIQTDIAIPTSRVAAHRRITTALTWQVHIPANVWCISSPPSLQLTTTNHALWCLAMVSLCPSPNQRSSTI
jgi:hypothetical protein